MNKAKLWFAVITLSIPVAAASWSTPYAFPGSNWHGNLAIDPAGDAIAIWLGSGFPYGIEASLRNAGNPTWPAAQTIGTAQSAPSPVVRMDRSGNALAFWNDYGGIYAAFLPAGGSWQAPVLLTTSTWYPITAMNARGDAIVGWIGPNPGTVVTRTRPAGGNWGPPVTVATVTNLGLDGPVIGLGGDGSGVLAYQTHLLNNRMRPYYYQMYVTCRNGLNGSWTTPASAGNPSSGVFAAHQLGIALDGSGNAVLIADQISTYTVGLLEAMVRPRGGSWSAPVTISPGGASLGGIISSGSGQLTASWRVAPQLNSSVVQASGGNIRTNKWGPPVTISSAGDFVWTNSLAGNASGQAVASWTTADSLGYPLKAQAAVFSGGSWGPAMDLFNATGGFQLTQPVVGVNAQGGATALWSFTQTVGYAPVLYTSDYTP